FSCTTELADARTRRSRSGLGPLNDSARSDLPIGLTGTPKPFTTSHESKSSRARARSRRYLSVGLHRGVRMYPLRVLIGATWHAAMGDTGKSTGVWLEELAVPYMRFVDAGADVTVTSIMGGKIPVDPRSTPPTGPEAAVVERFLADPAVTRTLAHS